jgi:hypothetical protein
LRIAHLGPLPPAAGPLARWGAALVAKLARRADVGAFVEGYAPDGPLPAAVRVHDLAAVHWRNALFAYDVALYELADDPTTDFVHDALCGWPGIVLLHGDDPRKLFARAPRLRRAVLEHSLALVVRAPSLRDRLQATEPWTRLFLLEDRRAADFEAIATELFAICGAALEGRRSLVAELLETACAEMPGFAPGDVDAPWRAELDELISLGGLPRRPARRSKPAPGPTDRKR